MKRQGMLDDMWGEVREQVLDMVHEQVLSHARVEVWIQTGDVVGEVWRPIWVQVSTILMGVNRYGHML